MKTILVPAWISFSMLVSLLSGCACHSNWFRSCGPAYQSWGVNQSIKDGMMIITIDRLPPGQYEITARRNWQGREEILARGTITVIRAPSTRVEITLAMPGGVSMPRDAFVVIRRLDKPIA